MIGDVGHKGAGLRVLKSFGLVCLRRMGDCQPEVVWTLGDSNLELRTEAQDEEHHPWGYRIMKAQEESLRNITI